MRMLSSRPASPRVTDAKGVLRQQLRLALKRDSSPPPKKEAPRGRLPLALLLALGTLLLTTLLPALAEAQLPLPELKLSFPEQSEPKQLSATLKMLFVLTVLSLAPAVLISVTSFTRIIVVLSFVRQAIGTQNVPPMQLVMALSLLLTGVVMAPVGRQVYSEALGPYLEEQIGEDVLWERTKSTLGAFLMHQTRESDLLLFYELSETPRPETPAQIDMLLLVPAFMISELRTGFEMGFLLFLPFVLIDLIVASLLTAMGMMMLPPTMISTPLKLLLFVVADGWALLTRSLVSSFT